ncbi:hypothetical protein GCM10010232_66500 [Streptomyces amakusaensis]|uniref:Uncharacterized protein n=1 Tax=Streptomyces amakusaensis TaxID=67271 RepID=A0ABW0ARK7_9ACTN
MESSLWLEEGDTVRARLGVCLRAEGMSVAEVEATLAEAEGYAAEAEAEVRRPSPGRPSFLPDPEVDAADCAARVSEWRRVLTLMRAEGWETYQSARDETGSRRAAAYENWRQGIITRAQEDEQRRRDAVHELDIDLRLDAATGRRIRGLCARYGISPERLLAQLAERAAVTDDGTVTVEPFTPS